MADGPPYVPAAFVDEIAAIDAYSTLTMRMMTQSGAVALATLRAYADILGQAEAVAGAASWRDPEQQRAFELWFLSQVETRNSLLALLAKAFDQLWLVPARADLDGVTPVGTPIVHEEEVTASESWLRRHDAATINAPADLAGEASSWLRRLNLAKLQPLQDSENPYAPSPRRPKRWGL